MSCLLYLKMQLFLSHAAFFMSLFRREHLKHFLKEDHKDLCKKVTDKLFGLELSKACKDISKTPRATTKILKNSTR